ncbi:hypothetical protein GCM10027088_59730 [Nocardia goodfellowii]
MLGDAAGRVEEDLGDACDTVAAQREQLVVAQHLMYSGHRDPELVGHFWQWQQGHRLRKNIITAGKCTHPDNGRRCPRAGRETPGCSRKTVAAARDTGSGTVTIVGAARSGRLVLEDIT